MAQSPDPYTFDVEYFLARFPTPPAAGGYMLHLAYICSPTGLVDVEHYRAALAAQIAPLERHPCDVFTWAIGTPPDRDITKLGGLPYRPADAPWPRDEQGHPLAFLGQIRFVESRDIVGNVPGDLLLVFVNGEEDFCGEWTSDSFVFEWQKLGIRDPLKEAGAPTTVLQVPQWYGVRHRTFDLEAPLQLGSIEELIPEWDRRNGHLPLIGEHLARLQMTKIGGLLPFPASPELSWPELILEEPVLFSMSALYPAFAGPYPFVNHPERLSDSDVYSCFFAPGFTAFSLALLREDMAHPKVHVMIDFE